MRSELWLKAARHAKTPDRRRLDLLRYRQEKLREDIRACRQCPLSKRRNNAVPWSGPLLAEIALVGEAPGYHEDKHGIPFVGKAGKLLDQCLETAGIPRDEVAVLNTVCCRPPSNRKPEIKEALACRPWFEAQLEATGAWLILVAGNAALWSCLREYGISKFRGKLIWRDDKLWLPIIHPAYYLRSMDKVDQLSQDLALAKRVLDGYERVPVGSVKTIKGHKGAIGEALEKQGWVHIYSTILEDQILVVRDDEVIPPAAIAHLPTYTLWELRKIRMLGEGFSLGREHLQHIHTLKTVMGGKVV